LIIKCIVSPPRQQEVAGYNPNRGNQGKPTNENSRVAQTSSYGGNPSREAMRRRGGDN